MKIIMKREKGTGIIKKDGEESTRQIIRTLDVSWKSIDTAVGSIKNVASHYQYYHKNGEQFPCNPNDHVGLTQGNLIDLRDAIKMARRNVEQCESVISTLIYLSGVEIIEEDERGQISDEKVK